MEWLNDKKAEDEMFMLAALNLARRGEGWVNPNPQVGCVVMRHGEVIGQGWHTQYGKLHAEREALADCAARGEDPSGATVYVTLEPCCHYGKTPPCTEALIDAGVKRVVVGAPDPNPLVAGKGVEALRAAGIKVDEGVLLDACVDINRAWLCYIRTGRPYVIAKYAMTADGKIATRRGVSQWLTGHEAVQRTHRDRHACAAIMVGVGTVLADDPQLTCRWEGDGTEVPATAAGAARPQGVRQPLRVVVDALARTPLDGKLVRTASDEAPVLVAVTDEAPSARVDALRAAGVAIAVLPAENAAKRAEAETCKADSGADAAATQVPKDAEAATARRDRDGSDGPCHVDLDALIGLLGQRGIDSLIVEGGPTLHASVMRKGLADAVQVYVAGRVFGGAEAPGPVGGCVLDSPLEGLTLVSPQVEMLGSDVLLTWEIEKAPAGCRGKEA